jgi:gamma-glutamylcyclotransferase (GGCT)/AIG2-like uncharacterized protein YtfP
MLYFSYGSNSNKKQMLRRCPDAVPLKPFVLDDHRLVFRYFADIEPSQGNVVHGALWSITEKCEETLDRYEGVKSNLYFRRYFLHEGKRVLYYKMNEDHYELPSEHYAKICAKGYKDFSLPQNAFYEAIKRTYIWIKKNEKSSVLVA